MEPILEVCHVTGGYSRSKPVLHDLDFKIAPGEMVGLIGLNGAGKSTTIKHILGLMREQSGQIRIHGKTLAEAPEEYRGAYAYVPENPLLFEELTVREHLEMTAMAYSLDRDTSLRRIEALLEEFQMTSKIDSLPLHLSKGMRQKVMIMNAFLVEPAFYIIDEPFLGLDPLGIRSLLELMVKMKQSGAAILMSSHILSTIEKYCDRFLVLHQGRFISQGSLRDIKRDAGMPEATLEEAFYELVKGRGDK